MDAICVKLDEGILKNIDKSLKQHNYSTRTDFIREAIRDKLKDLNKEEAIKRLEKYFGAFKGKGSGKTDEEIREEVGNEYKKRFGLE